MEAVKNLLFPFTAGTHFFEGFAWASELSRRLHARLFILNLSPASMKEESYEAMMQAAGHHLQYYGTGHSQKRAPRPGYKVLELPGGELTVLGALKDQHHIDLIVVDPKALPPSLKPKELIGIFPAAVVMPDATLLFKGDRFSAILDKATLLNIPNDLLEEV